MVSRPLGHRDIKRTQHYAHLDDRELARAIHQVGELGGQAEVRSVPWGSHASA